MIVFFYPVLFALLLLPVPIAIFSLLAVGRLGRAAPGDEARRSRKAIESAVCLNILCLPLPYLLFAVFGFLIIPAAMFGIAASVAGQAGRKPFLYGALACPWFPLPLMLYWGFWGLPMDVVRFFSPNVTEDSINRPAMVLLYFAWVAIGVVGAGIAALILRSKAPPVVTP